MLDPITSLLAACVNCDQPRISPDQPDVTVCSTDRRSNPTSSQQIALSNCISPPETTSDALQLTGTAKSSGEVGSQTNSQNRTSLTSSPGAPESTVLVSWSNSTSRAAAPGSTALSSTGSNPSASSRADRVLQFGSREQAVSQLQRQLRQLGYYAGAIDGIYGQQTRTAVAQFQRSKGLQSDGVVGKNTWAALQSVARPSSPSTPQPVTPSHSPTAVPNPAPTPAPTQVTQNPDSSPQSGFNYLWILGWVLIYGGGWMFILKDTVKEMKGFHFMVNINRQRSQQSTHQQSTHQQSTKPATVRPAAVHSPKDSKVSPRVVIYQAEKSGYSKDSDRPETVSNQTAIDPDLQPAPTVVHAEHDPGNSQSTERVDRNSYDASNNYSYNYSIKDSINDSINNSNYHSQDEQVALADPWQQENIEVRSPQVFQVALADDGQVQPLQNVFVVAPRPTHNRRRVKKNKPPFIYPVKPMPQSVKTG